MHVQTSQKTELFGRTLKIAIMGVFAVFAWTFVLSLSFSPLTDAATSSTINFQARLEASTGSIAANGTYNVEFKLYNAASSSGSSQGSCSGDSACLWTEDYLVSASNGVQVVNGYLTVNLGSITSFPSNMNWNQQLWLTMRIGGTGSSPSWDTEMSPRLSLTASPYSFQAGELSTTTSGYVGTLSFATSLTGADSIIIPDTAGAGGTVCLQSSSTCGFLAGSGTGVQLQGSSPGSAQTGNFNVSGTGIAGALQAGTFDTPTSATLNLGSTNASAITVGNSTSNIATTINGTAIIKPTPSHDSNTVFQVQNAAGNSVLTVDTTNNQILLGKTGSSGTNGQLVFNSATSGNYAVSLNVSSSTSASYALTLPTAEAATGQCLQAGTVSGSSVPLTFGSCIDNNTSITEVAEWDAHGTSSDITTLGDSPATAGDLLVLTVQLPGTSVSVNTVSGGGVATGGWTKVNANSGNGTVNRVEMWMGKVATAGSGTITLTYNGTVGATNEITTTEFTANGVSINTAWGVDNSGVLRNTSSNTVSYPSLTSAGPSELYMGYAQTQNAGSIGSSTGFTYILTGQSNVLTYTSPTLAGSVYAPTANEATAGQSNTVAALITAFISSTAINNSTSLQQANFNVQAASTGSVAGVLQAASSGTGDILDLRNSTGANVATFGSTGTLNLDGDLNFSQVSAPSSAPTAAVGSSGSLTGTYYYVVTYVTAFGQTNFGPASNSVSPSSQQVNLTAVPVSSNGLVTGRDIYRSNSMFGPFNLVGTISNNTATTFTDNNTSPGAFASDMNQTTQFQINGTTVLIADSNSDDTALGVGALSTNGNGWNNTALGDAALTDNVSGYDNSALGYQSLNDNTNGYQNSALGFQSLYNNTTGYNEAALGVGALGANTTGNNNSALGYQAGNTDSGGNFVTGMSLQGATAIGAYAQVQASNSIVLGSVDTATKVGIGTTIPLNTFSVSPMIYNTGTACSVASSGSSTCSGTSTTYLYGSGTTWTSSMVGDELIFSDGQESIISAVTSNTSITLTAAVNEASGSYYRIHIIGLQVTSAGNTYIQNTSTTGFQVQNASGVSALTVDTTNQRVDVGTNGTAIGQLYVSGSVPTSAVNGAGLTTSTHPESVYVQGNYAYSAGSSSTLQIIDVSNPASPSVISTLTVAGSVQSVYVQGRYAYLAEYSGNNLQIVDVSNPNNPTIVSTLGIGTNPYGIYVQGRYAYVVNQTSNTLQIVDVSNPNNPISIGSTTTNGPSHPVSLYVQGHYAYVGLSNGKLQIFDVSDPAKAPVSVGIVTLGASSDVMQGVSVSGRYAYVVDYTNNTLYTVDVSIPTGPVAVGSGYSTGASSSPYALYLQGRYAYVVNSGTNTLQTIDISSIGSPNSVGTMSTGASSTPQSVFVQGRYAYVDNYAGRTLQIFDLGGAYIQQLQTGGLETGTLQVDTNANISGDTSISGGLSVGQSAIINGNLAVAGVLADSTEAVSDIDLVQDAGAGTNALTVDNNLGIPLVATGSDNLLPNGDFEGSTGTTGWSAVGTGASITQNANAAYVYSGSDSLAITVSTTANVGAEVTSFNNPLPIGTYVLSFWAKTATAFSTLEASFSATPGTNNCTLSSTSVSVSAFTEYSCTYTTSGTTSAISIGSSGTTALAFYVDAVQLINASSTNLLSNPGFETGTTGWSATGTGATIAQNSSKSTVYDGQSDLTVTTGTTANSGAQDSTYIAAQPSGGATYTLSFFAEGTTAFTTLQASLGSGTCTLNSNTLSTTGFQEYYCTATTTASPTIEIGSSGTTAVVFYLDDVQLVVSSSLQPYNIGQTQLGGVIANPVIFQGSSNSTTALQIQNTAGTSLLTADTTNMQIIIGNTTNGISVSTSSGITEYGTARHTNKIILTPEYAGAVLDNGGASSDIGTMTAGYDSTQKENYYQWTTAQSTNQTYDIVMQIPIPSNFSSTSPWASNDPLTVDINTSDTTNGTVVGTLLDTSGAAVTNWNTCSLTPTVTGWITSGAGATHGATCNITTGTWTAGGVATLRLHIQAPPSGTTKVGDIVLTYISSY